VAVTVKLPTQLRDATNGQAEVSGQGGTVGEVLESLYGQFDALRARLCGDDGELRRFVNVYVAGEDIRFLDGLATQVDDGAELNVLPAVAGGA
jgi:sulfur-carrier protein